MDFTVSKRHFWYALGAVTLIKLIFSITIPVYYDEWYYVLWGKNLAATYYDHPPLIGWTLAAMSIFGDHLLIYRLLPLLASLFIVWAVYALGRRLRDEAAGRLAALLFVLSPTYILMFMVSSDSLLIPIIIVAALLYYIAVRDNSHKFALLSGVVFGIGVLAKYLIIFPAFGILVYALWSDRKTRLKMLLLTLLASLPFVAYHLYANYMNCWQTINFHLFLRKGGEEWYSSLAFYLIEIPFLLTPWGLWYLWRDKQTVASPLARYLATLSLSGLALFAIFSYKTIIGAHYFLVLIPFLFALYGLNTNGKSRYKAVIFSYIYGSLYVLLFTTLLLFPWNTVKDWKYSSDFVLGVHPDKVCGEIDKYSNKTVFSSYYAPAAILGYECKRDIQVAFSGSYFGREYDKWTNFEALDKTDFLIVDIGSIDTSRFEPFFTSFTREIRYVEGAPFTFFSGFGFNYAKYRDVHLNRMRDEYYTPAVNLPVGACPVTDRYYKKTDTSPSTGATP